METFETKDSCPPVESFIWDRLSFDYGCEFAGVRQLSTSELVALRALCDAQLAAGK